MAGMFYSLKEVAEKLNKTEDQIKEFVKHGKLREFRDGSNLLFKMDEIEALLLKKAVPASEELPAPAAPVAEEQAPQSEQPTEQVAAGESKEPPEQVSEDEIVLAPEPEVSATDSGLNEADTAITHEGISVLGETDRDYPITDDMLAETLGATGIPEATDIPDATSTAPEASLEEIEEDVNLDTFGSGSGLLDLSLQADDTSLGGIIDEIYTTEGESAEPAEPGTAADLMAEGVEEMLPEEELAAPQSAPELAAISQPYAEPEADVQSSILGKLLILPFMFLIYTAVVAILGQRGVMPSLLAAIQGSIWYIVIAAVVVAGLVVGAAFMLTGDSSRALTKPAKPKKAKKPKKPKKPKKAKKKS